MFLAVTFAPTMTLPLGSVTVPRIDPRKLWAEAKLTGRRTIAIRKSAVRRGFRVILFSILKIEQSWRKPSLTRPSVSLAGEKHRLRRMNIIGGREARLVQREADASAGIDEQQGLLECNVAERPDEWDFQLVPRDRDLDRLAAPIAELQEIIGAHVGDQVAEGAVESDDFAGQARFVELGGLQVEANQLFDCRADLGPIVAAREVSADGRKNVAPVEGRGNLGADHPIGICDFTDAFDAVAIFDHRHQAVVR